MGGFCSFDEEEELSIASDNIFMRTNPFETISVVFADGDEEVGNRGRPTNEEVRMRNNGKKLEKAFVMILQMLVCHDQHSRQQAKITGIIGRCYVRHS